MQEEKKWWKKFSAYQIVAFVLTILFVIGSIVTIAIIVSLKNKIDDRKKQNDEIEKVLPEQPESASWQKIYENEIINFTI